MCPHPYPSFMLRFCSHSPHTPSPSHPPHPHPHPHPHPPTPPPPPPSPWQLGPLREWTAAKRPTWGTCAGMILLADRALGQKEGGQALLGGVDVTVNRN
jgi:hypothetical protein